MSSQSRYKVPDVTQAEAQPTQLIIRKSKFVTHSCRVASHKDALDFIKFIKQKFPDATHICWAYNGSAPASTLCVGYSDDGEPHGTAGQPILQVLLHSGLGQICTVVSRWFGGIKLGTGGLSRAYQQAAQENLASLPTADNLHLCKCQLILPYSQYDLFIQKMAMLEIQVVNSRFQENVTLDISLPYDRVDEFKSYLANNTKGSIQLQEMETGA